MNITSVTIRITRVALIIVLLCATYVAESAGEAEQIVGVDLKTNQVPVKIFTWNDKTNESQLSTTIEVTQYQGLIDDSVKFKEGTLSSQELNTLLSTSGYKVPVFNFKSHLVLFFGPSPGPNIAQAIEVTITALLFDGDNIENAIRNEMFRGGAEGDGKKPFVVFAVPKQVIGKE